MKSEPYGIVKQTYTAKNAVLFFVVCAFLFCSHPVTLSASSISTDQRRSYVYKETPQGQLMLFVDYPSDWKPTDRRPAIIFFYGGGWQGGRIEQFSRHAAYFAQRGIISVRADYRVRKRQGTSAEAAVEDARSAIRWLRSNAGTLGINPDRIIASGASAGGHLAACTAQCPGVDSIRDDLRVSARPNALVLFNPVIQVSGISKWERLAGSDEIAKRISPDRYVQAGDPPTLLMFGSEDDIMQSVPGYVERMKSLGIRVELYVAEGAGHGFFNRSPWYERTLHRADAFLVALGFLQESPIIKIESTSRP